MHLSSQVVLHYIHNDGISTVKAICYKYLSSCMNYDTCFVHFSNFIEDFIQSQFWDQLIWSFPNLNQMVFVAETNQTKHSLSTENM